MFGKLFKSAVVASTTISMVLGSLLMALGVIGIPQTANAEYTPAPLICMDENLTPTSMHFDVKSGNYYLRMTVEDLNVKKNKAQASYGDTWGITSLAYNDSGTGATFDLNTLSADQKSIIEKLVAGTSTKGIQVEVAVPKDKLIGSYDSELQFQVNDLTNIVRIDGITDETFRGRMRDGQAASGFKAVAGNTRCLPDDNQNNMLVQLTSKSGGHININIEEHSFPITDTWQTKYDSAIFKLDAAGQEKPNTSCKIGEKISCIKQAADCTGGTTEQCNTNQVCEAEKGCVAISSSTPQSPTSTSTSTGTLGGLTNDTRTVTTKDITISNPLGTSSAESLIVRIINWLIGIAGTVAILMIIFGGFQYITSAGNPEASKKAVTTLRNAIIGLVIIILSFLIVQTVVNVLGSGNGGTSTGSTSTSSTTNTGTATTTTGSTTTTSTSLTSATKQTLNQDCQNSCTSNETRNCTQTACSAIKNCQWIARAGIGGTCETSLTTEEQAQSTKTSSVTPSSSATSSNTSTQATVYTDDKCAAECKSIGGVLRCGKDICEKKVGGGGKCSIDDKSQECVSNATFCKNSCEVEATLFSGNNTCTQTACDATAAKGNPCIWNASQNICAGK